MRRRRMNGVGSEGDVVGSGSVSSGTHLRGGCDGEDEGRDGGAAEVEEASLGTRERKEAARSQTTGRGRNAAGEPRCLLRNTTGYI